MLLIHPSLFVWSIAILALFYPSAQLLGQKWHDNTIVYQIYPRSFKDSNGDGIGDLRGIIQKLDELQALGVGTLWISPFFQSPQEDWGYDISGYTMVDEDYGTIDDTQALIDETHERGMHIIFDLVMNHTSEQHPWFQASRNQVEGYEDFYVWAKGRGRNGKKPPTNWKSLGNNGWIFDTLRKEFYWSAFLPFQPDLNYRNPAVKEAMFDVVRFWLGRGVDGFRLDMFNALFEDSLLRDNPFAAKLIPSESNPDGYFQKAQYNMNQAESFAFAAELRKVLDEFPGDRYLVGEVYGEPHMMKRFCKIEGQDGLDDVFLFETISTPFSAKAFAGLLKKFGHDFEPPFSPTWVFSNHDRMRSISRLKNQIDRAKLLAVFQMTVRGTQFIYYGEEIGLPQAKFKRKDAKDPLAHKYPWLPNGLVRLAGQSLNRDECRTTMHWSNENGGGFSDFPSWVPFVEALGGSLQQQRADSNSLWNVYRELISIRKSNVALEAGTVEVLEGLDKRILAFKRVHSSQSMLMILNFSPQQVKFEGVQTGFPLFNTHDEVQEGLLLPWQGIILRVEN